MFDWRKLRAVFMLCAALGWWGMWFPELAVMSDAVCATQEKDGFAVQTEESVVEYESAEEICRGLMYADREQIHVKLRLFELVRKYLYMN